MKGLKDQEIGFSELAIGVNHMVALSGSFFFSNILKLDRGNVYVWGAGINGELGTGFRRRKLSPYKIETPVRFIKVSAGFEFSVAISGNFLKEYSRLIR